MCVGGGRNFSNVVKANIIVRIQFRPRRQHVRILPISSIGLRTRINNTHIRACAGAPRVTIDIWWWWRRRRRTQGNDAHAGGEKTDEEKTAEAAVIRMGVKDNVRRNVSKNSPPLQNRTHPFCRLFCSRKYYYETRTTRTRSIAQYINRKHHRPIVGEFKKKQFFPYIFSDTSLGFADFVKYVLSTSQPNHRRKNATRACNRNVGG